MSIPLGNSAHAPLSSVTSLWKDDETVLVLDSLESDGRFVLCSLVASSSASTEASSRVLWLCCSAVTDQLTLSSLKKIGCSSHMIRSSSLPESSCAGASCVATTPSSRLTIRSVATLLSREIGQHDDHADETTSHSFNLETFVKNIYREIKEWVFLRDDESLEKKSGDEEFLVSSCRVVLDDVSTLAVLVGERLAYGLIFSLRALSTSADRSFGLAIRCSNDADVEAGGLIDPRSTHWFGAGDDPKKLGDIPWERQLVELADTIVDVVPLANGYTREAHGRLVITNTMTRQVYNYCLTDNEPLVVHL